MYKRPNLDEFIQKCSTKYSLAVWSSAEDSYVKEIVKKIFPSQVKLEFVWTRLNCSLKIVRKPLVDGDENGITYKEHQWIKPLNRINLKGFGIKNTLIIDNSSYKVKEDKKNAIIIEPFEGGQIDNELLELYQFLSIFDNVKDVRKIDKAKWTINHLE